MVSADILTAMARKLLEMLLPVQCLCYSPLVDTDILGEVRGRKFVTAKGLLYYVSLANKSVLAYLLP